MIQSVQLCVTVFTRSVYSNAPNNKRAPFFCRFLILKRNFPFLRPPWLCSYTEKIVYAINCISGFSLTIYTESDT